MILNVTVPEALEIMKARDCWLDPYSRHYNETDFALWMRDHYGVKLWQSYRLVVHRGPKFMSAYPELTGGLPRIQEENDASPMDKSR